MQVSLTGTASLGSRNPELRGGGRGSCFATWKDQALCQRTRPHRQACQPQSCAGAAQPAELVPEEAKLLSLASLTSLRDAQALSQNNPFPISQAELQKGWGAPLLPVSQAEPQKGWGAPMPSVVIAVLCRDSARTGVSSGRGGAPDLRDTAGGPPPAPRTPPAPAQINQ